MIQPDSTYTIDFADLREHWLALVGKTEKPFGRYLPGAVRQWERDDDFNGCTVDQMKDWLANGYRTAALEGAFAQFNRVTPRRKLRFSEEGELQADLAMSGFDQPFLEWERRPRKPGLAVNIELSSSAATKAEVIAAYTTWLAQMLLRFETAGYDLEINVTNTVARLFSDGGPNACAQTRVRVKRENEATDYQNWSAMFSPGGLRMLMFCAKAYHAESKQRKINPGLGGPLGTSWECTFDSDSRTLSIICPRMPRAFDPNEMTTKLERLGI